MGTHKPLLYCFLEGSWTYPNEAKDITLQALNFTSMESVDSVDFIRVNMKTRISKVYILISSYSKCSPIEVHWKVVCKKK